MICPLGSPLRRLGRRWPAMFLVCGAALLFLPARGQDPLRRYPQNYKLIFDNAQVAVIRVHYGPHETVGVHDHSNLPTLFVYLNTSGAVRFHIEDIPPSVFVRQATRLGSFRYSPGRRERHTVENLSDASSDFLRIELKQFPLQGGKTFRHDAPTSLAASGVTTEFSNSQLEVERVVCSAGATCTLAPAAEPSVLVALSQVTVNGSPEPAARMDSGDVRWVQAEEAVSVVGSSSGLAHVLRIRIKAPRGVGPGS